MSAVMGIDPGTRGAVSVLIIRTCAPLFVRPFRPSMTHGELVRVIREGLDQLALYEGQSVFVEKVGVMPRDGRRGANTFGRVDGLIRGALHALGYPPIDVMPMVWQGAMNCLTGGDKSVTRVKAAKLFPTLKVTNAIADALLIAAYGRQRLLSRVDL